MSTEMTGIKEPLIGSNPEVRELEEPDVLSTQQVNQALMDIEDIHPLRNRVKFYHILPCLSVCKGKNAGKDFDFELRRAMLSEMGIKMPKSDKVVQEDPFLLLGFGVNNYFDIMKDLMKMFTCISLFVIPLMYCYSHNQQNGLSGDALYALNQFSLGNLGASDVYCKTKMLQQDSIDISCPVGRIDIDNVLFGVMSDEIENHFFCTEKAIWADPGTLSTYTNCTSHINEPLVKKRFVDKCFNQTDCTVSIDDLYLNSTPPALYANNGTCGSAAYFYVQAPCLIPYTQVQERKIMGLMFGCVTVFVYLFVVIYFDYIKCIAMNTFVDWDVKSITAGDYSVEFDLDVSTYDKFKDLYFDKTNPMSENSQFKLYIQNELEDRLNDPEFPDQGYDDGDEAAQQSRKKIAQITFAYENGALIEWLKDRGYYVKNEKWTKAEAVVQKIEDAITSSDPKFLDKLQTPCSVFVTFETEEGLQRALAYNETPQAKFLGEDLDIQQASEPTDIIWENREYEPSTRTFRRVVVWTIIFILLSLSAAVIYKMTLISNTAKFMFPPANCTQTAEEWNKMDAKADANPFSPVKHNHLWQVAALIEYHANAPLALAHNQTHFTDVMQCYCSDDNNFLPYNNKSEFNRTQNFTAIIPSTGKEYSVDMCVQFDTIKITGKLFGTAISFVIIAVNLVLKTLIIALITWISQDTESEQLTDISNGVFVAQFFNTGLLLLFVNANLTEHNPQAVTKYFKGPFYDYMPEWYGTVGVLIVKTMIINSIMPYVGLVTAFAVPALKRKIDNGFTDNVYKTKKTSMALYKALYSGNDYVIHFKQSGILNIVYMTMMYGVGMPILFPVAAFNFMNQYVCERIIVAYTVPLPPALDDKLSNNMISLFYYSPLLMLYNGYWMLSNPEIFANKYDFKDSTIDGMKSQHFAHLAVDWASPVLLMGLSAIFIIIITKIFGKSLMKYGFSLQKREIEVDEGLPNFFEVIRLNQADQIVKEEQNMKENFGIYINDPDTVLRLDNTPQPKKACQGTPWYTVLSNMKYQTAFNYIGAYVEEREKLIEDGYADIKGEDGEMSADSKAIRYEQSDLIIVLLNLACIPDSVVKKMDLKAGWQKRFKGLMAEYKENFHKEHGVVYRYQDQDLEDDYRAFVQKAKLIDPTYKTEQNEFFQRKRDSIALQEKLDEFN